MAMPLNPAVRTENTAMAGPQAKCLFEIAAKHRRPQRTRRPIRNWVPVTTPLCLRNGARETREKTRKGMRGVGWEAHVTSRDPTLDAVATRSCAIRRGISKKPATAIFDLSLRVGPHPFALLTFNIVQSSEDFHAAILVSCSTSALQAAIKAVMIRRPFAVS